MSNDLLYYDGENLARNHDVVVVTHNHRLNIFGYLNLGYLNLAEFGDERYASSSNVGMLAILAVMQWVRYNIVNFGGDPSMPSAQGLFHRASAQSGSAIRSGSPVEATRMATAALNRTGRL